MKCTCWNELSRLSKRAGAGVRIDLDHVLGVFCHQAVTIVDGAIFVAWGWGLFARLS